MDKYQTFFQPIPEIQQLVLRIEQQLGHWASLFAALPAQQQLVLQHRALQANLALDQNSLSVVQLQVLAAGKRVVALDHDIQQAKNALQLLTRLDRLDPYQTADLCQAHFVLMSSVLSDAGQYRLQGTGVYEDHKLVHMPPPPAKVSALVASLFHKLQQEQHHPLISACLVHYQLAFIHPFSDGNGRLCRFWQQLVLSRWQSVLSYLPFTTVLKDKARDYYKSLRQSVPKYDATAFILFMLRCIEESLNLESAAFEQIDGVPATLVQEQSLVDVATFIKVKAPKLKRKTSGPWFRTEDQILKRLKKDNRLSAKTIADELGLSSRAIEKQLAKLKAEGKLLRTGPAKGGRWQVVA